ncbi:MAG: Ppx/GppA family phosphatase [Hyphomicrobiales bacterium]|nr:Ppx/GppA family phosphatase [Hyphomicrobiales bacterium]
MPAINENAPGRIAGAGAVAVIDIGSNSVRLVAYERHARSPTPLFNEKVLAGLGAGVATTGVLSSGSVEKALAALRRFTALAAQMRVINLHVLATAAIREAENGAAFIDEAEEICGVPITILSGEEEARISACGVISAFDHADGVAGDLGGGSLELAEVGGRKTGRGETLALGGLRLQAACGGSLKAAAKIVRDALAESRAIKKLRKRTFYAVGGTWRSLARLHMRQNDYPLHVIHDYRFPVGDLKPFLASLTSGDLDAVRGIESVSKQRLALLPYGAIVLTEIIRAGRPDAVAVSALGLREGFLYSRLGKKERRTDPLLSAARELAILRSRSPAHAQELIGWTGAAMAALGIEERTEEKRLRAAACLLADIGWRAHPDYRGEQSLNIIAHAGFVGIGHPGRAYLALAAYYRHSGLSDDELGAGLRDIAPPRYLQRARALAAIFRVAYLVSASMPGIIPRTRIIRDAKTLVLELPEDLAMLAGGRLATRLKQLANLADLESEIRVLPDLACDSAAIRLQ